MSKSKATNLLADPEIQRHTERILFADKKTATLRFFSIWLPPFCIASPRCPTSWPPRSHPLPR